MQATPEPFRILFIGNSYTSRNQLPRRVADLAASGRQPKPVEVAAIVAGGASLRRHWNAGLAQRALAGAAWTCVVLQEQSTLPIKNVVRYHDNVRRFVSEIKVHGARTVLYQTWARQQAPQTQDDINRAVEEIAAEVGALVVPVGRAWQAAIERGLAAELYERDGSHPTVAGSYLAACVFVVSLLGEAPVGFAVSEDARARAHACCRDARDRVGLQPAAATRSLTGTRVRALCYSPARWTNEHPAGGIRRATWRRYSASPARSPRRST